ncbi:MAG: C4-type zinc ribbon domain-containing protein [Candidatus Eremiobacterota bacterium]
MILAGKLQELQAHDLQAAHLEKELAAVDTAAPLRTELEAARREQESTASTLAEQARAVRAREKEVQELAQKQAQLAEQFYRLGSPKEVAALEAEQARVQRQKDELEEDTLAQMERQETLEATAAELKARIQDLTERVAAESALVEKHRGELLERLERERSRRRELAGRLPADSVALYEQLRKAKGTAVGVIAGSTCGGCRMDLPDSKLRSVRGSGLERCPNCGRILAVAAEGK